LLGFDHTEPSNFVQVDPIDLERSSQLQNALNIQGVSTLALRKPYLKACASTKANHAI